MEEYLKQVDHLETGHFPLLCHELPEGTPQKNDTCHLQEYVALSRPQVLTPANINMGHMDTVEYTQFLGQRLSPSLAVWDCLIQI